MAKIKNILIFAGIAVAIILVYVFFLRPDTAPKPALQSTPSQPSPSAPSTGNTALVKSDKTAGSDFLTLLLSVKNIKLEDAIFENSAFDALEDSSIELVHEGNEGRINPFAKIGFDETAVTPTEPEIPVAPLPLPAENTSTTP